MKRLLSIFATLAATIGTFAQNNSGYPITPVPFTSVKVAENSFWGQRLEASRKVTIPLALSQCEANGRYKNFERAVAPSDSYDVDKLEPFPFDDTDPYKTIEGASYILQTYPDNKLKAYIDSVLDIIAKAQEPDGYLFTARTMNPKKPHSWAGKERWIKEEDLSHELYNLGHMAEAAVAHWQATGSRKFLDIATRYADCVIKEVGSKDGQACVVPGHQIAEMALCRLYLATGNRKYLDEAKFFLDYRGKTSKRQEYSQSHKPVVEQDEAVGHAVRAAYMYAGMADVAALTGDSAYIRAIDNIWENIVGKKLYITGGIGATSHGEAFGKNFYLPNMSAYCETCAAIGNVYVNHRLFLLHGDSKYYDVLERTLYNGLLDGVSLDGGRFFYPNPLASTGQHQRQPWFGCACCPSNICRFIPSLPGYVYAVKDRNVYVNLFLGNSASLKVQGKDVVLTQNTEYPYDGDIRLVVNKNKAGVFALKIRVPGWINNKPVPTSLYSYCDNKKPSFRIYVNGSENDKAKGEMTEDGYFTISRKWKANDVVRIHFDMEPRIVKADNRVEADRGMVAVERGPIVYCAEHADNNFDIKTLIMNRKPTFNIAERPLSHFLPAATPASQDSNNPSVADTQKIKILTTDAQTLAWDENGRLTTTDVRLTLIPYHTWCHRGSSDMMVWLPAEVSAAQPAVPATAASTSKVEASMNIPALSSVNDKLVPQNADDRSVPYTHWWPKKASTEWVSYTFPKPTEVSRCKVWWFDDQPWGGCSVPKSWKILYKDNNGQWQDVEGADKYPTLKGQASTVDFNPIKTNAIKLEVTLPDNLSSGIFEWEVE